MKNANISHHLESHARLHPDRILLESTGRKLSCAQLQTAVAHAAGGFASHGIGPGDTVVLLLPLSVPMYVSMFALQRLGAIPVFLDSWARSHELGHVLMACRAKGLVTVGQGWSLLGEAGDRIPLRFCLGPTDNAGLVDLGTVLAHPSQAPIAQVDESHTALVTFTTGSTGKPKGADRSHGFLEAQHRALARHLDFGDGDADLPVFPIFSLHSLASGARTILPSLDISKSDPSDGQCLLEQIRECQPTSATLSVPLLQALTRVCEETGIQLELRRIVTGGAPVSRDDLRRLSAVAPQATVCVLYGSTEVEPMGHLTHHEILALPSRAESDPDWVDEGVPVGMLDPSLRGFLARLGEEPPMIDGLLQREDWDAREGPGELVVSGEHVCPGYFADPEATRRAKLREGDGSLWHRTGDVVRRDTSGMLWLLGRVHNTFQYQGRWHFPVRAEFALKKIPGVRHVAWLNVPDSQGQPHPWAVLVPENPLSDSLELEDQVRRILACNGIPVERVVVRADIPLDARHHAKVEVEALRALLKEPSSV
jgi:acyl-CoA synthetase (AMP-forming)/AMP-acid ligase II